MSIYKTREKNRENYNKAWKHYTLQDPQMWPHWQFIQQFKGKKCLEIGPGVRPKIPIHKNYFLDISIESITKLKQRGGKAFISDLSKRFPFPDNSFDLVCAFEVLEHLPNETFVLKEIARILKPKGIFFVSFPLHPHLLNAYDLSVGHARRYKPEEVDTLFKQSGLRLTQYDGFSVLWPGRITGIVMAFLTKNLPFLFIKLTQYIDSLPFSSVQRPITFKKWGKKSLLYLNGVNTGIFLAEKSKSDFNQEVVGKLPHYA